MSACWFVSFVMSAFSCQGTGLSAFRIVAFTAVCFLFLQVFIILSCSIAVGTNLSQFICIGRFTAVSFQVLGHMKTILVLILGFLFFGKEGLNVQVVVGMIIAVARMIWYSNVSTKPGGKERRSHSMKHGSDSTQLDDKV